MSYPPDSLCLHARYFVVVCSLSTLVVPSAFFFTVVSSCLRPPNQPGLSLSVCDVSCEQPTSARDMASSELQTTVLSKFCFILWTSKRVCGTSTLAILLMQQAHR